MPPFFFRPAFFHAPPAGDHNILLMGRIGKQEDTIKMNTTVLLALLATLGTWAVTALGAATVAFFKSPNPRILNLMLGFAARCDDRRQLLVAFTARH